MSAKAAVVNLYIEAGATYRQPLAWKADGVLVDLSGATARMMFREDYTTPVLFSATTESGHILLGDDGAGSNIMLSISAEETAGFTFDTAIYDLEIQFADSGQTVRRLMKGKVAVSPQVTYD